MGTSENQHSNVLNRYVESNQHQWSRDRCRTHLCTLQTRAEKELVISYAIISRSLAWAAWTCSHIQLQVYLVTEFTSHKPMVGYKWKVGADHVRSVMEVVWHIVWSLSESYICLWVLQNLKIRCAISILRCTSGIFRSLYNNLKFSICVQHILQHAMKVAQ